MRLLLLGLSLCVGLGQADGEVPVPNVGSHIPGSTDKGPEKGPENVTPQQRKERQQRLIQGTIRLMHEKFCVEVDHWSTHIPCKKHKLAEESSARLEAQMASAESKGMDDGAKRALHETETKELHRRFALLDEDSESAKQEADNEEMRAWFCGQDNAKAATKGSGVRMVCDHWAGMQNNLDHDANHHFEEEHGRQKQKEMPPGIRAQMHNMSRTWCSEGDRRTTNGPCMRYILRVQVGRMNETQQAEKMDQIKKKEQAIRDAVPVEVGEQQFAEMHDWWCGRPEATTADADSDVHRFCLGWEQHKADLAKAEL